MQAWSQLLVHLKSERVLIAGDVWTSVCSFRVTLYRHRVSPDYCDRAEDVRFAYFQKCEGIVTKKEDAQNIPFLITVRTQVYEGLIVGYRNRRCRS